MLARDGVRNASVRRLGLRSGSSGPFAWWRRKSLGLAVLAACAQLVGASAGNAQTEQATEARIKGAYLYKFPSYVEWPEDESDEPFLIGVAGGGDVAEELERLAASATIKERPIAVRRVDIDDSLDDFEILFVGSRERGRLDEWLASARELPLLTVTESEGALAEGSIINFTIENDRVRFEISLPAAGSSGLRLDARLLAVAQRVERAPE